MDDFGIVTKKLFQWRVNVGSLLLLRLPIYLSAEKLEDKMGWVVLRQFTYREHVTACDFVERGWWGLVHEYIEDFCLLYPDISNDDVMLPMGLSDVMIRESGFEDADRVASEALIDIENDIESINPEHLIGIMSAKYNIPVDQLLQMDGNQYTGYVMHSMQLSNSAQENAEASAAMMEQYQQQQQYQGYPSQGGGAGDDIITPMLHDVTLRGKQLKSKLESFENMKRRGKQPKVKKPDYAKDGVMISSIWAGGGRSENSQE